MRRRRKWLIAGSVVAALIGGLWISAPAIIKWRIHARYPDVTVGEADLGWKVVWLRNITFDRKWVSGTLTSATATWDEDVTVDGGHIDVDLDKKPPAAAKEATGHHISFRNLTVHIAKGKATVDLQGVESDRPGCTPTTVCWASGTAKHPQGEATFRDGCAERDGSLANVDDLTLKALDIPHIPSGTAVGLRGVVFKDHTLTSQKVNGALEMTTKQIASFHATDVTVELPTTTVDSKLPSSVAVGQVTVEHPWIWTDPVTFTHVKATPDGHWWHVTINGANFDVNPEALAARGQPEGAATGQACQTWVDALPVEMRVEPLSTLKFEGNFSWKVDLNAKGPDGKPKPSIDFSNCRIAKSSCGPITALHKPFTYWVYDPMGDLIERRTGPGTDGWTPLTGVGPMPTAVINSEDYMFRTHKGFVPWAYYAALEADVKAGGFIRGGSTITMQLAKNLWLRRSKTIGRKVQELFLTMGLESCLSKDEIMELYLNVVEFGPLVYGISAGSHYWFHKEPIDLENVEAFWLASILTSPNKAGKPTPEALEQTAKLMKRLQTMGRDVGELGWPIPLDDDPK
jgi:Transglycosylase